MKTLTALLLLSLSSISLLFGDSITLKNGKEIDGKITSMEGDDVTIDSDGIEITLDRSDIAAMDFGSASSADSASEVAKPAAEPQATQEAPAVSEVVVIPAGTALSVSIQSTLASNRSKPGQQFKGLLVADVRVGDVVVIPSGSPVTGTVVDAQKSGRGVRKKPAELSIALRSVTISGKEYPIQTLTVSQSAAQQRGGVAKGAVKGAALGGIAGAIVDDAGDGAAAGAAVGATKGFISKGDEIEINMGAVIGFQLRHETKL